MADLSIVVVNWNTRALLARCLDSLFAYPPPCAFDVWVVDNASSDGSVELLRRYYPQVNLMVNPHNVGFARANNLAIRASAGRHLLLLNSDAVVLPGTLANLFAFAESHPAAAAIGCRLLNSDGTLQPSAGQAPSLSFELLTGTPLQAFSDPYRDAQGRRLVPLPAGPDYFEVEHISGACMWIRRDACERVALFDEDFFLYGEESDLCYRLRRAGWRIYYYVQASAVHQLGASAAQFGASRIHALYRGKYRYFRKHGGQFSAEALRLILLLRGGLKCAADLCGAPRSWAGQPVADQGATSGLNALRAALTLW